MVFDVDVDCTAGCSLTKHGNLLTKALTKREIDEDKLIKFLAANCGNFARILDENGRSCLHICSSNSKPDVAEFLIRHGANINQKDTETNWTPLHRSINYACLDVAVVLKRAGASFDVFDADFVTPLQLIQQTKHLKLDKIDLQAVVWGRNKNYNLGIGNVTERDVPDVVKGLPAIKSASINKFHSLFLTSNAKLWASGHSKEGRLGTGNEATVTSPQEISVKFAHKNETIVDVYAGMFHSLILTNKSVYGTGSNKYYQLGLVDVDMALSFREIPLDRSEIDVKNMLSVIACDFHSLFTSKTAVFVCGLNVGQFNGIQESILVPRRMPYPQLPNSEILWTASNNACICIYLKDKNSHYLHIFCSRKMKTYKNPLNERLKQCTISGGELLYNSDDVVKNSSQKPLSVFLLTEHHNLYIWYEDIMQFTKVHVSPSFMIQITMIRACNDELLLHANHQLFRAAIQHKVQKLYHVDSEYIEPKLKRDIAHFLCAKLTIKRVSNLSHVEKVFCDPDGESFIALLGLANVKIEKVKRAPYDFSELLDDYHFSACGIMDVKFIVKGREFSTNRYLVCSRCEYLENLIKLGELEIKTEKLTAEMFQCILTWIYKEELDGDDIKSIFELSSNDQETVKGLIKDFNDVCIEWKLHQLVKALSQSTFYKALPKHEEMKIKQFNWFNMENFPQLCDVTIQLEDNQTIRAHKVVLMMRIEYFKMMFCHSWSEDSIVDMRHMPIMYMKPIIQFAYDNNVRALLDANFTDNFLYCMCAILDQYLIEDLKNVFETIIIRKVNLRNCAENLSFAITYNCQKLKEHCMSFICLNLPRVLESTSQLETLDVSTLRELSEFYRRFYEFETKSNHIMTPAFDAQSDEDIETSIEGFDLAAYCEAAEQAAALKKTPKSKSGLSKSELARRSYEKSGMETLRNVENVEPASTPKSPEIIVVDPAAGDEIIELSNGKGSKWQKQSRERKDSGKRKALTASKVNEIAKSESTQSERMVDLKSLRKSLSEDVEEEAIDTSRSIITLADFCVKDKKKAVATAKIEAVPEQLKPKLGWNMDNIELKPANSQSSTSSLDLFGSTPPAKKNGIAAPSLRRSTTSTPKSSEKNFNSIIRDERKEKTNYEKIKSKSLILTQIEEQAIIELSQFYNIENIFDENITIERKVHKASQNLSQWTTQRSNHSTNGA